MGYDGSLKFDTSIDTKGFSNGISSLKGMAEGLLSKIGTAVTTAITTVSAGMFAAGGAATKIGMEFESSMSEVQAISGATGKELEILTDKAKEMGASTKFSARESAEAFKYMAMAGWKSEDMLEGIEGVMNLAAAGGEDLATTSDIVTDAITAFGLKADDATHFADVLAKASSSANTNVSMLGESFKYVAPLAGAMNYSVEDVSFALGLMANSSVKGSMAGTSLKTALANLSSPTKNMAGALKELGLITEDGETALNNIDGSAKPLKETLTELRTAFSKLDETQKTEYASTIFGKEAMSGMLAIINASDEDFEKLAGSIENADGAAKDMAETMMDNLDGDITIMKSSLQGLSVEIYQTLDEDLREAVQSGTEYITRLTQAFTDGGLEGAVEEAGEIFGELATRIVDYVPDVINSSVNFIKAFAKGITDNKDTIIKAVKEILYTIKSTLLDLLPKNIKEPIENSIDKLSDTLNKVPQIFSNVFSDKDIEVAVETAVDIITNLSNTIMEIIKSVLPSFENGLRTVKTAFSSTGFNKGIDWQIALSNPIINPIDLLTQEQKDLRDDIYKTADSYNDLKAARDESYGDIKSEYNYLEELWEELDSIVDANGKIKEGYEDRAGFITETLNGALDTEIEKNGNIITNYKDIKESIYDIIEAKKAQAYLDANQDLYNEAVKNKNKALSNYVSANNDYQKTVQDINDTQENLNETIDEYELKLSNLETEYDRGYISYGQYEYKRKKIIDEYYNTKESLENDLSKLRSKLGEQYQMLYKAEENWINYSVTITNYEDLSAAIFSEDTEKIKDCLENMVNDFQTAETGIEVSLTQQVENMKKHYDELKEALKNGTPGVTKEMVDSYKNMVTKSEEELKKFKDKAKDVADETLNTYAQSILNHTEQVSKAAEKIGYSTVDGMNAGIDARKSFLLSNVGSVGLSVAKEMRKSLGIKSPSKVMRDIFRYVVDGCILGINDKEDELSKSATELAKRAICGIGSGMNSVSLGANIDLQANSDSMFGELRNRFNNEEFTAKLKAAAILQSSGISNAMLGRNINNYTVSDSSKNGVIKATGNIETHINIDGREFAVATVPYIDEELAFIKG